MTTNTQQKAPGAANAKGLHTDTNAAHFASHGAVTPAHDQKNLAPDDFTLTTTATEARIDSRLLARQLGNKNKPVIALIDKYQKELERYGKVFFKKAPSGGKTGQLERFALLNEDQAFFVLALSRNTDTVVNLKVKLVKAFGIARRAADLRKTEYLPEYHLLHDRIAELAVNSTNGNRVHQNFNRLLNKFAGIEAGQRASAALPQQALLIVGQLVASKAAQSAVDHHDGYQLAKASLQALHGTLALEVIGHE